MAATTTQRVPEYIVGSQSGIIHSQDMPWISQPGIEGSEIKLLRTIPEPALHPTLVALHHARGLSLRALGRHQEALDSQEDRAATRRGVDGGAWPS